MELKDYPEIAKYMQSGDIKDLPNPEIDVKNDIARNLMKEDEEFDRLVSQQASKEKGLGE